MIVHFKSAVEESYSHDIGDYTSDQYGIEFDIEIHRYERPQFHGTKKLFVPWGNVSYMETGVYEE